MSKIEFSESVRNQIETNLGSIRERIASAAARAENQSVQLVAVTKYAQLDWIAALLDLGHRELGENRPQQMVQRADIFADVTWHLIGQLQRNKVRPTLGVSHMIHSVDSMRLLQRIDLLAGELQVIPRLLLEVNVSKEAAKAGFAETDLKNIWPEIVSLSHVEIAGLMAMAPRVDTPEDARPFFAQLRKLRDSLAGNDHPLPELSMGMSGDFEVAIEEGATLVRVGSSLFNGLERDSLP